MRPGSRKVGHRAKRRRHFRYPGFGQIRVALCILQAFPEFSRRFVTRLGQHQVFFSRSFGFPDQVIFQPRGAQEAVGRLQIGGLLDLFCGLAASERVLLRPVPGAGDCFCALGGGLRRPETDAIGAGNPPQQFLDLARQRIHADRLIFQRPQRVLDSVVDGVEIALRRRDQPARAFLVLLHLRQQRIQRGRFRIPG